MFFEAETPFTEKADEAYEAIRMLNHQTIMGSIPGPHLYVLLGNLKFAGGHALASLLDNCSRGLVASLGTHDVYEDDGSDPAPRVGAAAVLLTEAANHARRIGELLEKAQLTVSGQGYRDGEGQGGSHDPAQLEEES